MNKTLTIFGAIALSLLIFSSAVSANAAFFSGKDLIAPDSSFSFLQTWKESIQTFFTFGAENKANQYLHLADVRLNEYKQMTEQGKTEIAQRILDKYEKQLNQALSKAEELKSKGEDVKDLSQKIEEAVSKHLEVLQNNLEKVPEQARQGIENAIENSQKIFEKKEGVGIANPASVNCLKKGGTLEIRKDAEGGETGFCIFPDKSECEEWALFKGECKKDETANWKTYRNEKYGFEIKYPQDWYVKPGLDSSMIARIENKQKDINLDFGGEIPQESLDKYDFGYSIVIYIKSYPTLENFLEAQKTSFGRTIVKLEASQFGTNEFYKLIADLPGPTIETYYTYNNRTGYDISIAGSPSHNNSVTQRNALSAFHQILSTFKFIK